MASSAEIAKELTVVVLTTRHNELLAPGRDDGTLDAEKAGDTVGRLYRKILSHVRAVQDAGGGTVDLHA